MSGIYSLNSKHENNKKELSAFVKEFDNSTEIYIRKSLDPFTVGELVEILKKIDPNKSIWIADENNNFFDITDINASDKKVFLCIF